MSKVLDRPTFMSDTKTGAELDNDSGFPQALCVIAVGEGRYAANVGDTKGFEPDPQTNIRGLAVFPTEGDAKAYMNQGGVKGISGTIEPKTFAECRTIAVEKKLSVLWLFALRQHLNSPPSVAIVSMMWVN